MLRLSAIEAGYRHLMFALSSSVLNHNPLLVIVLKHILGAVVKHTIAAGLLVIIKETEKPCLIMRTGLAFYNLAKLSSGKNTKLRYCTLLYLPVK